MKLSSRTSLSSIYDKFERQLRALESLGVTTDMCVVMLYPLVESSLPEDLLRVWQRNTKAINSTTSKQRLDELMSFLQTEVMSEERVAMAMSGFGLNNESAANQDKFRKKIKNDPKEIATTAGLLTTKEDKTPSCIFCSQKHESASCRKAKRMSYEERCKVVKTKNACFYCTKIDHSFKDRKYKGKCAWCGKRHVLIMCCSTAPNAPVKDSQTEEHKIQEQSTLANISLTGEVFLQTLRVKLFNQGKEQVVRAIFDTGSHRSYILDRYAKKMGFEAVGEQQIVYILFGGSKSSPLLHKEYRVNIRSVDESYSCNFVTLNQRTICEKIPPVSKRPWLQELQQAGIKLSLSDVDTKDEPIAILLGADITGKLLTGKRKELRCGAVALETLLEWTLIGKVNTQPQQKADTTLMVVSMFTHQANVTNLWKLDTLGILTDPILKKTEDIHQAEVKENFRQTIKIDTDSRYEVLLPWKANHLPLTNNISSAVK